MPCYDPPMPWEKSKSANEVEAVKILCDQCRAMCGAGTFAQAPRRIIDWFLEHRKIDASIAETFQRTDEYHEACRDIASIEAIIVALERSSTPINLVKCTSNQFPDAPTFVAWEIPELSQLEMVSEMSDKIPHWATRLLASVYVSEVNAARQSVGSRIKGNWIVYSETGGGQFVKGGVAYYRNDEFKKNYTVIN